MTGTRLIDLVMEHMERPAIIPYPKRSLWATDGAFVKDLGNNLYRTFGSCPRATVMNMMDIGPGWVPNSKAQLSFDLGHQFEAKWQTYFKEIGIWRGSNVKWFDKEHEISGEFDAVVEVDGETILVEFKTGGGFFKRKKVVVDGILSDNYLLQVGLYLWQGRDIFKNGARLVYWVYSDKGIEPCEFVIDVDEDWNLYVDGYITEFNIIELLNSFDRMRESFENNIIPARGYWTSWPDELKQALIDGEYECAKPNKWGNIKTSDWNCSYCSKSEICAQMPDEEMDLEQFLELFPEYE